MSRLRLVPVALMTALLLATSAGVAPALAATPAPDETAEEDQGPPDETVAIPYLGEATISAAPPWRIAGCTGPLPDVEVDCAEDGIALRTATYDPAWGEHTLFVELAGPGLDLEVGYRITLAAPDGPVVAPRSLGYPVVSGAQTLVPLSLLDIECTLCTPGGGSAVEVGALEPAAAGFAAVTGAHLALRITPGFLGDVVLPIRISDDAGGAAELEFAFRVSPAPARPFGALHVVVAASGTQQLEVDLTQLLGRTPPSDPITYRCATPVRGAVECVDGIARYTPAEPVEGETVALDQFAVQAIAADGRQALASVTIVPQGAEAELTLGLDLTAAGAGSVFPAPVAGEKRATLVVASRIPDDGGEESVASPLDPIAELLERAGTR